MDFQQIINVDEQWRNAFGPLRRRKRSEKKSIRRVKNLNGAAEQQQQLEPEKMEFEKINITIVLGWNGTVNLHAHTMLIM